MQKKISKIYKEDDVIDTLMSEQNKKSLQNYWIQTNIDEDPEIKKMYEEFDKINGGRKKHKNKSGGLYHHYEPHKNQTIYRNTTRKSPPDDTLTDEPATHKFLHEQASKVIPSRKWWNIFGRGKIKTRHDRRIRGRK